MRRTQRTRAPRTKPEPRRDGRLSDTDHKAARLLLAKLMGEQSAYVLVYSLDGHSVCVSANVDADATLSMLSRASTAVVLPALDAALAGAPCTCGMCGRPDRSAN